MTISRYDDPTNTEIQITSVYFRGADGKQRLESYPRRMVYDGREYTFMESGIRYLVQKGQELIQLFDMSDGVAVYRLRRDSDNHWSLVNMKALA